MKDNPINEYLEELLDEDPITKVDVEIPQRIADYLGSKQDVLAQIYAFTGFREVMQTLINSLVLDAAVGLTDVELFRVKQGRIMALKQLLSLSKKAYDKINSKPKQ
jgi:hypothetical protein